MYLTQVYDEIQVNDDGYVYCNLSVYVYQNEAPIISGLHGRLIDGKWVFFGLFEYIKAYMEKNNLTAEYFRWDAISTAGVVATSGEYYFKIRYLSEKIIFPGSAGTWDADIQDSVTVGQRVQMGSESIINIGWVLGQETYQFPLYWWGNTTTGAVVNVKKDGTYADNTNLGTIVNGYNLISLPCIEDVVRSTVVIDNISKFRLFRIDSDEYEVFSFRNIFNDEEQVFVPGSLSVKSSVDFDDAVSEKTYYRYDVTYKKKFTLVAKSIPSFMHETLLNLCRGRKVKYRETQGLNPVWHEIVVKDYKLPKSTAPSSVLNFEMTFEMCNIRSNEVV